MSNVVVYLHLEMCSLLNHEENLKTKLNFCEIYIIIIFGGRLLGTENKRICQIYGLNNGRGR